MLTYTTTKSPLAAHENQRARIYKAVALARPLPLPSNSPTKH